MFPPKRRVKLAVALPGSFLSEAHHLRDKTYKAGIVGRACAIFRVDEVIVYLDRPEVKEDARLLVELLEYMNSPQYLRKMLYPLKPTLRYAGVLPPLRTPNHPLESKVSKLPSSSFREGVVVKSVNDGSLVEVGLDELVKIKGVKLSPGNRVIVRLVKVRDGVEAYLSNLHEVDYYFGFKVRLELGGLKSIAKLRRSFFILATSRLGSPLKGKVLEALKSALVDRPMLVVFGSPKEGLMQMAEREGLKLNNIADLIVNFIPHQGVETVRTEEALMATLSIINWLAWSAEEAPYIN